MTMNPLTVSQPPAAAGLAWIKEGWRLFMLAPISWTGMTALVFLVLMAVGMLPVVGRWPCMYCHRSSWPVIWPPVAAAAPAKRFPSFIWLRAGAKNATPC